MKQYAFGLPPPEPTPPPQPSTYSYTQSLLARFNLPAARPASNNGGASTASDFYTLLASAVSAASSSGPATQTRDLSNSGTLIPPNVHGAERLSFISAQRERLSFLLSALDREANTIQTRNPNLSGPTLSRNIDEDIGGRRQSVMSSRKSETDFEKIDAESGAEEEGSHGKTQHAGGSWMPWGWGARPESSGEAHRDISDKSNSEDRGRSSGLDL